MTERYREIALALVVGVVVALCGHLGFFDALNARVQDSFVSPKPVDPSIVIVAIDDESLQSIGQWPWPRAVFADLINKLAQHPPHALGIDVIFAEPSRVGAADDGAFARSLASARFPIVLAAEASYLSIEEDRALVAEVFTKPLASFDAAHKGITNLFLDPDSTARRFPTSADERRGDGAVGVFSMSILAAASPDYGENKNVQDALDTGRIVYAQPTGGIRRISFNRALEEPELLEGKIVLVGATVPSLHDEQRTPMDRGTLMPGVEIQANIVNMLLRGYTLREVPFSWVITLMLALASGALFLIFKRSVEPLVANGVLLATVVIGSNILFDHGTILPVAELVASCLVTSSLLFVYRYIANRKQTRALYDAFGRYVSPSVLREIVRHPEEIEWGGAERDVTVLFCDIRGFTTLSERLPAPELVALLNRYFSAMSREIVATGGTIDKYIGDAIMAFWGAPLDDSAHAEHAVRAAIGMVHALERFNAELATEGREPIAIGIGIASGPAVVGNIGSRERLDYTAMGDTVNTASRLEGLTKEYKQAIVIADSTKRLLPADIETVALGEASVKGKTVGVKVHGVVH